MKFQFRLEKILNLVRLNETVKKMEVASVIQRVNFLENRKNRIQDEIRALLEKSLGFGAPDWFQFRTMRIEMDVREQKKIDSMLVDVRDELRERQKELEAIIVRRKSLEAIKEKRLGEFKKVQARQMQKQLDEIYQLTKNQR